MLEVFESGQFSPDAKVKLFEEKFAALHKAEHGLFVSSGTDALRLGLLALKEKYEWPDGAKVLVPALTFVATVNVILQAGLLPEFVDVNAQSYLIDPALMLKKIGPEVVAVVPVHLFGRSCDPSVFEIARGHNLKILEDSCETILNPIVGDVSCHSTYMAHHVTTGVGGLALTNDSWLVMLMRSYANHGRDPLYLPGDAARSAPIERKHLEGDCSWVGKTVLKSRFHFPRVGYSCRATEFEAALGLAQLGDLQSHVLKRWHVGRLLLVTLSEFEQLILPPKNTSPETTNTFMMFPIVLKSDSGIDKYDLCLHLEKNDIETRDMMPITNQPCYKGLVKESDFPVAENINKNGFYIPCNEGMTEDDVKRVREAFSSYLTK